jgi:2-amino-4-hydroxy-6-hydroxymethyldihydropteridine diphosphokinase
MTHTAYVAFGANQGDRLRTFDGTIAELGDVPGTTLTAISALFETQAVGLSDGGGAFLNAVMVLRTVHEPPILMGFLQGIEARLGKSPRHRSDHSRPVDLDLLLFDDRIISQPNLTVPHPRMHERAFVLFPLAQIAPEVVHPVLKRSVGELANDLPATQVSTVRILPSSWQYSPGY